MDKVALEGLEFYAYHGYYDEEQKIGNKFLVDIVIEYDLKNAAAHDNLDETVDYSQLHKIAAREMARPSRLMEAVAHRIIKGVFDEIISVQSVEINISKINPPIGGICDRAKISIKREKET